jgi:hypothetical protein
VPAPTYAYMVGEPMVKTGRWHGIKWKLTAQDRLDGSYCVAMTARRSNARSCGSIQKDGISYLAHTGRLAPAHVVGPVIAKARSVQIKSFDRPPIRTSTIAPPPGALFTVLATDAYT